MIGATEDKGIFCIGHSKSQSMTFLPDFEQEQQTGYMFGDLAGFFDTGGSLVDLVNCFVTKKLFQMAREVKMILVLTVPQIEQSRGQAVKDTMKVMQSVCQCDMQTMCQSIQPVLSMCKPGSDIDIDKIRSVLYKFGQKEMNNQMSSFQAQGSGSHL